MGINDRDYGRSDYDDGYGSGYGGGGYGGQPGLHLGGPKSMTVKLVIVTAIVYVIQLLFRGNNPDVLSWFDSLFSMQPRWFVEPWRVFEFLTYGFLHDPWNLWHIAGNMFVLWMFGRMVEDRYGSKEFLAIYLTAIVFAAITWDLSELVMGGTVPMLGASGGVSAILLLFIFLYPRVTILFMFIIPMPAWVLGVFIVASDMFGAIGRAGEVAFTAHLGGFLFAYLYYKSGIRLTDYLPAGFKMPSFKPKPKLRVHRPDAQEDRDDKKERRLDELLRKVNAGGQDSLTSSERRELQKLSKYYQDKRK